MSTRCTPPRTREESRQPKLWLSYMYSTRLNHTVNVLTSQVLSAQDRLSILQETKLKAAYISLAPNDEGLALTTAVWRRSVPAGYLWRNSIRPST